MAHIPGHVSIPGGFNQGGQPVLGGVPPTGLIGFEQALRGGLQGSLQTLGQGIGGAQREIDISSRGQGIQSALAGLAGPQAQNQAFQNFQSSPGFRFALEEAERGTRRDAAAIGGLGGGNVRRELERVRTGLAAQDFGNQFQRGQQALGTQLSTGRDLANLSAQGGILGANLISGAAGDVGQARFGTGQQLAQAAGGTTSALATLQNQLGIGQANIFGQGTTNLANLVSGTGQASSQLQQQLAIILANIGTGTGSALAQPTQLGGQFDAAGILGQNTAVQNALSQLLQLQQSGAFSGGGTQVNFGGGSGTPAFNAGAIA